jgi:di/tricarboxylate transporter
LINLSYLITAAITISSSIVLIADWLRPDLVALMVMALLGITGQTTPSQTFAGFSSSATITILSISIIAEGLTQSGVTRSLSQLMKRLAGQDEGRLLIVVLLTGAVMSFFMNNVAALGVLLPATISLARQTRSAPSRLLMPLSFGVIAGGMSTLFTTSNIIASTTLHDAGLRPFGVLDFLPVGLPVVIVTALYMYFFGRHILPVRFPAHLVRQMQQVRDQLVDMYGIGRTLTDLEILPESPLANKTIRDAQWTTEAKLNIAALERKGQMIARPDPGQVIHPGDIVIAFGNPADELCQRLGLRQLQSPTLPHRILNDDTTLAELVIPPHSNLADKTIHETHFRERFNSNVLAVWRWGRAMHHDLANLTLRVGDGLLVQTTLENLHIMRHEHNLVVLEEDLDAVLRPGKQRSSTVIGLIVLSVAILNLLPISIACMAGAIGMVLTGCLTMDEAYQSIDWKAIFLIAGLWPLSTAIQNSGLAKGIVDEFLRVSSGAGPLIIVAILLVVTALLTNLMAGQSAAPIILAPIGLTIASSTGLDPRAVLMTIAAGCSLAFPTPIGHPVNIMVMGSGGYTYKNFVRIGGPLTILLFFVILTALHFFWHV